MVHASAAESVAAGRVGDRGSWSMWHSLARWRWAYCSGPRRGAATLLRRCWADSWVAASGILSGNTAAPSDCWTTQNIRAPFRLVTCRPQFRSLRRAPSSAAICVWPGRRTNELFWAAEGQPSACTSHCRRREIIDPELSSQISEGWFRGMHFPHTTHYDQCTRVNLVAGFKRQKAL